LSCLSVAWIAVSGRCASSDAKASSSKARRRYLQIYGSKTRA
jgi:hypothetical protein